jgi:hypothetical protein
MINFEQFSKINEMSLPPDSVLRLNGHQILTRLVLGTTAQIKLYHWQATKHNTHTILGDLYDFFNEASDKLIEVLMGRYGIINLDIEDVNNTLMTMDLKEITDIVSFLDVTIYMLKNTYVLNLTEGADDDIISIIQEITAELEKTKYLIKQA